MIKINLSPVRADEPTQASLSGTVLTLDSVDYDLSELPDGAKAQHPELGTVTRAGDDYELTIKLRHGPNASEEVRFPSPVVTNGDWQLEYEYDVVVEEAVE